MPKDCGRNTQSYSFVFLYIFTALQVCYGILTIILNEYFKATLAKQVDRNVAVEIGMRLSFMEIVGIHLIVFYGCGFMIVRKFRKEPYTAHLLTLLKVWHIIIFVVSIDGFLVTWMLFKSADPLMNSIELSLQRGIEVYYASPEWRIIWDDMQFHQQCCGVQSYKDWQTTSWIEYEYDDNVAADEKEPSSAKLLSLTPYSCCKKDAGCFESYLPEKSFQATFMNLPIFNLTAINQCGCLPIIESQYYLAIYTALIISILVFLLQVLILLIMRVIFLHSSVHFPLKKVNSEAQTTFIVSCSRNDFPPQQTCSSPIRCFDRDDGESENLGNQSTVCNDKRGFRCTHRTYSPPRRRGGHTEEQNYINDLNDEICSKKYYYSKKQRVNFSGDEEYAPLLIH